MYLLAPPSAARAVGPSHTSHQEEASPAPYHPAPFLPSPSPWPLTTMLSFRALASRAAPTPTPGGQLFPGLRSAVFLHLCPLAPSHFPSPSAPSSSFQPEERFSLPSLTQRDFLWDWEVLGGGRGAGLGQLHILHTEQSSHTWPPLQRRVGLDPGRSGATLQLCWMWGGWVEGPQGAEEG